MRTMIPHKFLIVPIALALFTGGCTKPATDGAMPKSPASSTTAPRPEKLRLLVVDDPALAEKIGRVRREWEAQSGAPLEVVEMRAAELEAPKKLAGNAIIYPAAELGSLAERELIKPLPDEWLNRPAYAKNDLFELIGLRETAWAGQIYAVPLGSPVMVCFYQQDLFEQLGRKPPTTWAEYQKLVEFFSHREILATIKQSNSSPPNLLPREWMATVEPLAPGWGGYVLLARAAAYAKHPDYYSTLFDRRTMEPRIATAPFVRALEELTAAAHATGNAKAQLRLTPADARHTFLAGYAAMALGWPTAADSPSPQAQPNANANSSAAAMSQTPRIGFVELPGSPEMFNPRDRQWQPRAADADPHVSLLGIAGRMGSVILSQTAAHDSANKSPAAEQAFDLLVWLTTQPWDRQICPASPATTLFRRSQVAEANHWVESGIDSGEARQYADVEARSCSHSQWVDALRLPGHAEYMAALDDAVRSTVSGELTAENALSAAADRWREITKQHGLEGQRMAYAHSLSLEP